MDSDVHLRGDGAKIELTYEYLRNSANTRGGDKVPGWVADTRRSRGFFNGIRGALKSEELLVRTDLDNSSVFGKKNEEKVGLTYVISSFDFVLHGIDFLCLGIMNS